MKATILALAAITIVTGTSAAAESGSEKAPPPKHQPVTVAPSADGPVLAPTFVIQPKPDSPALIVQPRGVPSGGSPSVWGGVAIPLGGPGPRK